MADERNRYYVSIGTRGMEDNGYGLLRDYCTVDLYRLTPAEAESAKKLDYELKTLRLTDPRAAECLGAKAAILEGGEKITIKIYVEGSEGKLPFRNGDVVDRDRVEPYLPETAKRKSEETLKKLEMR